MACVCGGETYRKGQFTSCIFCTKCGRTACDICMMGSLLGYMDNLPRDKNGKLKLKDGKIYHFHGTVKKETFDKTIKPHVHTVWFNIVDGKFKVNVLTVRHFRLKKDNIPRTEITVDGIYYKNRHNAIELAS